MNNFLDNNEKTWTDISELSINITPHKGDFYSLHVDTSDNEVIQYLIKKSKKVDIDIAKLPDCLFSTDIFN